MNTQSILMATPAAEAQFRRHLRHINARETCLVCDAGVYALQIIDAYYAGRVCAQCGAVTLFVPATCGLRIVWRPYLRGEGIFLQLVAVDGDPDAPTAAVHSP
jgi:hypothetical protein